MVFGFIHQVFKFNWDKNEVNTNNNNSIISSSSSTTTTAAAVIDSATPSTRTIRTYNSKMTDKNMSITELNSMLSTIASTNTINNVLSPQIDNENYKNKIKKCETINTNSNNNNNSSEYIKKKERNSLFNIYIVFIILFLLLFLSIIFLFAYINNSTDIHLLRDRLKNDYIINSDIKDIVKMILMDLQMENYGYERDTNNNNNNNNKDDGSTISRGYSRTNTNVNTDKNIRSTIGDDADLDNDDAVNVDSSDDGDNDDNGADEMYIRNEKKASELHVFIREKRKATLFNDNMVRQNEEGNQGSFVDFFNPKIRRELEKKDEELKRITGLKGAAPGGDEWVWLTSYSRIPYDAITGFCSATKEYCPVGPPGIPGQAGLKGYRGDIGIPGPSGREGIPGARGPKGMPGSPGLDGRDGVPGEPGLDGVPGRAGADGIPGKDGKNGTPGNDGQNGIPGKDGKEGLLGPQGPVGLPGEKGMEGPKGRAGRPGNHGIPGLPAVVAYKIKINDTIKNDFLIAPSIVKSIGFSGSTTISAHEGDNVRLRCAATGFPQPHIEWRRDDNHLISVGAWRASSIPGHSLNITKINRVHTGAYNCIASNGIPPPANATFYIEVHFAPKIQIKKPYISANEGATITLVCLIEAFPDPVKYWKRNNMLIDHSDKYKMQSITTGYNSSMYLTIKSVSSRDFGEYQCSVKNDINQTEGIIIVEDRNKSPPRIIKDETKDFGPGRPPLQAIEDLCPPPCAVCPEFKCKDNIVSIHDLVGQLEVKPTRNVVYPGLQLREQNCMLYAVGKPVYHKFTDNIWYGAWLKDAMPRADDNGEKIWTTSVNDSLHINEYGNKIKYRNNSITKRHLLNSPGFKGNAHVVFNGSFYYHEKNSRKIIRYDLETRKVIVDKELYKLAFNGSNLLYTNEENYVDFNVDSNGLWAVYSTSDSNYTIVAKLDANDLTVQYSWNISINHHKVGEMFIVCGVLYAVDSVTERVTKIRFAFDLFRSRLIQDVNLSFTNPFKKTTTIGYNYRMKELYTWDRGNQLAYPTRDHEMGYNMTSSGEKSDDNSNSQLKTGYEIEPSNL